MPPCDTHQVEWTPLGWLAGLRDLVVVVTSLVVFGLFALFVFQRWLFPELSHAGGHNQYEGTLRHVKSHEHLPTAGRRRCPQRALDALARALNPNGIESGWLRACRRTSVESWCFAVTFALAWSLLQLVIFEIVGIMHPRSRWLNWKLALHLLALDLLVGLPFLLSTACLKELGFGRGASTWKLRALSALLLPPLWLLLRQLSYSMPLALDGQHHDPTEQSGPLGWALWPLWTLVDPRVLDLAVSRLSMVGVTLTALLSGFGASTMPFDYLLVLSRPVTSQSLGVLERQVLQCAERIAAKKKELLTERRRLLPEHGAGDGPRRRLGSTGAGPLSGTDSTSTPLRRWWLRGWGTDNWADTVLPPSLREFGFGGSISTTGCNESRREGGSGSSADYDVEANKMLADFDGSSSSIDFLDDPDGGSGGGSGCDGGGFAGWWGTRPGGSGRTTRLTLLQEEVAMLESLSTDLFLELTDMHEQRRRAVAANTNAGRVNTVIGVGLVVFCVGRVVLAMFNIFARPEMVVSRGEQQDVATSALHAIETNFKVEINVTDWAQLLSFVLVGVLMLSSTRLFIMTVWHSRRSARSLRLSVIPAQILAPLTTLLMGVYLLSSLLLLRINVPCQYRASISAVLGDEVYFGFYHQWFDIIFVLCALGGAALKVAKLMGSRHDSDGEEDESNSVGYGERSPALSTPQPGQGMGALSVHGDISVCCPP